MEQFSADHLVFFFLSPVVQSSNWSEKLLKSFNGEMQPLLSLGVKLLPLDTNPGSGVNKSGGC